MPVSMTMVAAVVAAFFVAVPVDSALARLYFGGSLYALFALIKHKYVPVRLLLSMCSPLERGSHHKMQLESPAWISHYECET